VRICPSCGEELPDRFRLCGICGATLAPPAADPGVRKTVTVVFCDLAGSTQLAERVDAESLRTVMDRYFAAMRRALETHGGTIEKFIGDAVMAVFGLPVVHEDDALRAVRAAVAMTAELEALNADLDRDFGVRLTNRTGVNTGEVIAGDATGNQRLVTGDAVNVAARLEQAAPGSGVLLGPLTERLVRDAVDVEAIAPLELKGKSERVPAFRLIGVKQAPGTRTRAPLVGRTDALDALQAALAQTGDGCRQRLLLGPAGVGKSRLVDELATTVAPVARVLRGRCLPYGQGITFWPLAELVRAAAGIEDADPPEVAQQRIGALTGAGGDPVRARVAAAIGLSEEPFALEELFWGARKLLEHLAEERPLVAVFEDLHWAERSFLSLLEHVTDSSDAPILIIGTARQEVLDLEPTLGAGARGARITLPPLTADDTARVLDALAGGLPLPEPARLAIVASAEGNPLYAEQMLSMLIDEGRLVRSGDAWALTGEITAIDVPPSIQAVLAARLDQLGPDERSVLELAAVVGVEFEVDAVRALAGELIRPGLDDLLSALTGKLLVAPLTRGPGGRATYRFQHALVRDSAYGRLLKRVRAELHERVVTWAEEAHAPREDGDELEEVLGYHLEQAHHYLRELAPLDEHGRALGIRAARMLGPAGERAFAREDMPAAANLLRRAADRVEPGEAFRTQLLLPLAEALMDIGEFRAATTALDEAVEAAGAAGDEVVVAAARLQRLLVQAQAGGHTDWCDRIARESEGVLAVLEAAEDRARLAAAWRTLAWAYGTAGRFGKTAEAADSAIVHAALADDDRQRRRASSQYAVAALYGPTPVADAIQRCESILAQASGDRRTTGLVSSLLARLYAMHGDATSARGLYRSAQALLNDGGRTVVAASTSLDSCGVEILAGDLGAAERELRRDYTSLRAMGETYLCSTVAGELARVLATQGRDEEAWPFSEAAQEMAADDDVASQALWRLGRARLLVDRDATAACALAEEAVELLRATDARVTQADALTDLAAVWAQAGRADDAAGALAEALTLHEEKGNRAAAQSTRALMASHPAPRPLAGLG
jgi:class 3 adenylate cyclase/tetratricopeptide (TPR) repeat protein